MLFKKLGYFTHESWVGFRRAGIMSVIATSTIAISLFILGVFMLIFFNLHNVMDSLHSKLDVVGYVRDDLSKNDVDLINIQISQIPGVHRIEFISKETAWQQFKESYSNIAMDSYLEKNPLPDAFKVAVRNLDYIRAVANKMEAIKGIEEVRCGGDIADRVVGFIKALSYTGIVVLILLVSSTLMIVINTIRLTVIARENEINIMSLVGATRTFVKLPFIFEGMLFGLFGALIALAGLKIGYDLAIIGIEKNMPFLPVNLSSQEVNLVYVAIVGVGILLGWIGGWIAVSKSLKQE
jgi:cell division transport system permease protein